MDGEKIRSLACLIYSTKQEIENQEKIQNECKVKITDLNTKLDSFNKMLLQEMVEAGLSNYDINTNAHHLVAGKFNRDNIQYKDENSVIEYLKNYQSGKYIKTKLTESIDKVKLKKALKTDSELAQALDDMTEKISTSYVVVTTKDKYDLMLEHMSESK